MVVLILLVGLACVLGGILWLRLHPFLALVLAAVAVELLNDALLGRAHELPAAARVTEAFGATAGRLALLIAMASLIGRCLLKSGGADRIVRRVVRLVGPRRVPLALMSSSFLLGIPVFFDTVFYLMIPLAKALRIRTGRHYLLYVLALTAGATMAHSLVPPTPGPLFAAEELGIELGKMMLVGAVIGLATLPPGYLYARWANARWDLPLRDTPELSLAELDELANRKEETLPRLIPSLLPVLLPVVLIGGATLWPLVSGTDQAPGPIAGVIAALGEKNTALLIAAGCAVLLYVRSVRPGAAQLGRDLNPALTGAAAIIMITAAGGAFGTALRATGIGELIGDLVAGYQTALLPLAFLVTAAVRTAQGSATVAMITAVGLLKPIVAAAELSYDPVYLAVAVGCGSKPLAWMNDSGFWVICRMSGLTEAETLRAVTPMTALMGITGLACTMAAAVLVPWPLGR